MDLHGCAPRQRFGVALAALLLALAGCGGDEDREPRGPAPTADRPAEPPPGWRTHVNREARFSLAAPRRWSVRRRKATIRIRSDDRLLAAVVAMDRGPRGKRLRAGPYARRALTRLTFLRRVRSRPPQQVRGSPYEGRRIEATGTVRGGRRQRVTVAALHLREEATIGVLVFENGELRPRARDRSVARLLASIRVGLPPR